jgi:hypothetical protein
VKPTSGFVDLMLLDGQPSSPFRGLRGTLESRSTICFPKDGDATAFGVLRGRERQLARTAS